MIHSKTPTNTSKKSLPRTPETLFDPIEIDSSPEQPTLPKNAPTLTKETYFGDDVARMKDSLFINGRYMTSKERNDYYRDTYKFNTNTPEGVKALRAQLKADKLQGQLDEPKFLKEETARRKAAYKNPEQKLKEALIKVQQRNKEYEEAQLFRAQENTLNEIKSKGGKVKGSNIKNILNEFNEHPEYKQYVQDGDIINDMNEWKRTHLPKLRELAASEGLSPVTLSHERRMNNPNTFTTPTSNKKGKPLNIYDDMSPNSLDREVSKIIATSRNNSIVFNDPINRNLASAVFDDNTYELSPNSKKFRKIIEETRPQVFIAEYPKNWSDYSHLNDIPKGYDYYWNNDGGKTNELVVYDKSNPSVNAIFGSPNKRGDRYIGDIPVIKIAEDGTSRVVSPSKNLRKKHRNKVRKPKRIVNERIMPTIDPVIDHTSYSTPNYTFRQSPNTFVDLNRADQLDTTDYNDLFLKSKQAYDDLKRMEESQKQKNSGIIDDLMDLDNYFTSELPTSTTKTSSDPVTMGELKSLFKEIINEKKPRKPLPKLPKEYF